MAHLAAILESLYHSAPDFCPSTWLRSLYQFPGQVARLEQSRLLVFGYQFRRDGRLPVRNQALSREPKRVSPNLNGSYEPRVPYQNKRVLRASPKESLTIYGEPSRI